MSPCCIVWLSSRFTYYHVQQLRFNFVFVNMSRGYRKRHLLHVQANHISLIYRLYCLLSLTGLISTTRAECATNEGKWRERANQFHCRGRARYHCMKNENNFTSEVCLLPRFLDGGVCPVFYNGLRYYEPCKEEGCPVSRFRTSELYRYPVCFGDLNEFETETDTTARLLQSTKQQFYLKTDLYIMTADAPAINACTEAPVPPQLQDITHILVASLVVNVLALTIFYITLSIGECFPYHEYKMVTY